MTLVPVDMTSGEMTFGRLDRLHLLVKMASKTVTRSISKVKDLVKEQYNFFSHTEFIEKYKFQVQPLKYYRFNRLEMPGLVIGALRFSPALVSRFAQNAAFPPAWLIIRP